MATVGSLVVKIAADTSSLASDLDVVESRLTTLGGSMAKMGTKLTAGLTAPLLGLGAVSVKSAGELNEGLANVASLGVGTERIEELRDGVQGLAVDVGKSTSDLTGGLYQVVSAFGDTSDTAAILEINARAATAGLATTEQAIALTSAVTKGYGDTSAAAVQKASDLAFMTVQLGQTTFPELASSMGRVVPLAASLGVSQETLAAQFATLTGVTGSTAEVSTQLRATYQSLLKPSAEMAGAIGTVAGELEASGQLVETDQVAAWQALRAEMATVAAEHMTVITAMAELEAQGGKGSDAYSTMAEQSAALEATMTDLQSGVADAAAGLGQSIVESVGMTDALSLLAGEAEGNSNTLGQMFGSVEALNAVLALSGPQADTFAEKLAAMQESTGAAGEAFAAQTEGVNSAGFEMEQLQQQVATISQDLGEVLVPALVAALDAVTPFVESLAGLVEKFAEMDPEQQKIILGALGLAAAIGPITAVIGGISTVIGLVTPVLSGLAAVIGTVSAPAWILAAGIALVVGVIADWATGGELIPAMLEKWGLPGVSEGLKTFYDNMTLAKDAVANFAAENLTFEAIEAAVPDWVTDLVAWAWPKLANVPWVDLLLPWAWPALQTYNWVVTLTGWDWPTLKQPSWIGKLFSYKFPSFPSRPRWLGGDGGEVDENARGTSNYRGGWTIVGEEGPELVNLPKRSAIYPADVTASMLSGGTTININNPVVRNEQDIRALARAVGRELQRMGA